MQAAALFRDVGIVNEQLRGSEETKGVVSVMMCCDMLYIHMHAYKAVQMSKQAHSLHLAPCTFHIFKHEQQRISGAKRDREC